VRIVSPDIQLTSGGAIKSEAASTGDAGGVRIETAKLVVGPGGAVSTSTFGAGAAGQVSILTKSLSVDDGQVSSSAGANGGPSGNVDIASETVSIVNAGRVATSSASAAPAGSILVDARLVDVIGAGSEIASNNSFDGKTGAATSAAVPPGSAGSITLRNVERLRLIDGGSINTNSVSGPAGAITILMPRDGLILLSGETASGVITTSSGPGTGGRITIAEPFAIISDGGDILALGQQGGANVQITSDFFIRSADRVNRLSVAGSLVVDSTIQDVSSGTTVRELNIVDASKVLRGQCAAVRSARDVSQLTVRSVGPFGTMPGQTVRSGGSGGDCD
jgi:hypothetical protein